MTDMEEYLAAPGRDDQVKEVRKLIDATGVEYVYYQFASVTGRIMGKGVPAKHWESMARKGFQLVYGATANLFVDRHGDYIGYGPEARELVGLPDPETFAQLPWDPKVARVFCTLFRGREDVYPRRFESRKTGKSGYSPACANEWVRGLRACLTAAAWDTRRSVTRSCCRPVPSPGGRLRCRFPSNRNGSATTQPVFSG